MHCRYSDKWKYTIGIDEVQLWGLLYMHEAANSVHVFKYVADTIGKNQITDFTALLLSR